MSDLVPIKFIDHGDRIAGLKETFLRGLISDHTRDGYREDLRLWLDWCARFGVDPLDARHAAILNWITERRKVGDAESTLARRLAAAGSWYRWLVREEQVVVNPTTLLPKERPKANTNNRSIALSGDQCEQLLDAADADGPRTAAIVGLLAYTGVRVGEMIAADVDDMTQDRGHPVLDIMGKGRRRRTVPLPPPAFARVETYLTWRASMTTNLPTTTVNAGTQPLISTARGGRLDRRQVRRDLRRLASRSGGQLAALVDRLSPHVLRHSYASDLLDDGVPVRDVQYAMGHADPRTTERYDHSSLNLDRHPTYRRAAQLSRGTNDGR